MWSLFLVLDDLLGSLDSQYISQLRLTLFGQTFSFTISSISYSGIVSVCIFLIFWHFLAWQDILLSLIVTPIHIMGSSRKILLFVWITVDRTGNVFFFPVSGSCLFAFHLQSTLIAEPLPWQGFSKVCSLRGSSGWNKKNPPKNIKNN